MSQDETFPLVLEVNLGSLPFLQTLSLFFYPAQLLTVYIPSLCVDTTLISE